MGESAKVTDPLKIFKKSKFKKMSRPGLEIPKTYLYTKFEPPRSNNEAARSFCKLSKAPLIIVNQ